MNIQEIAIYSLAGASVGLVGYLIIPFWWMNVLKSAENVRKKHRFRVNKTTRGLDDIFVDVKPKWLNLAYAAGPISLGGFLYISFGNNVLFGILGFIAGLIVPDIIVKNARKHRKKKFQSQMVDAILILSSSLKAGLSLPQSLEAVVTEMPPPTSQEFGLVIKANRMGLTLEEAMERMKERMACEELNLLTTTILVARETGGDVTHVIGQLVSTIREKKKLTDKVKTLTLQGRLQAYIMSAIPVMFAFFIRTFNPDYFKILIQDKLGNTLLGLAGILWLIGMVLLIKLSRVEV